VSRLLEGKNLNLRVMERDDIDFVGECGNDIDFWGKYDPVVAQKSKAERQKAFFDNPPQWAILCERQGFVIEKKDRTKIGVITYWFNQPYGMMEIMYNLIPNERGKGYGTETVQLIVDYLFLSKDLVRIQAITDVRNKASQRVLEKADFQREGTMRKCLFNRGEWRDGYLYNILREE
jgi:RimJ/RimL family protein N-acetyltransferase